MTEPLNVVWSRPLPEGAQPSTVTVSRDAAGRWYVSILVEDPTVRPLPATEAWYGRDLIVVDRWYPSSKICSVCGRLTDAMPLYIRHWVCPCGAAHDRDVNAARNILAAGLAERQNACGADVRPQGNTPGGQSAMKQEDSPGDRGNPIPLGIGGSQGCPMVPGRDALAPLALDGRLVPIM
ncbi:MAG TPA: transposase [Micromonosporaceae bacterium]